MLSFSLSKATIEELEQRKKDIKDIKETLNYYEVEILDIEKLVSQGKIDRGYIYMFYGLKITKSKVETAVIKLGCDILERYIHLSKQK